MPKEKFNKIWKLSIFITVLLGGIYIFQISNLTYYACKLTSLKNQHERLREENSFIRLEVSNKEPLFELEKLAEDLNFEKISQVQYIKATKGPVASK